MSTMPLLYSQSWVLVLTIMSTPKTVYSTQVFKYSPVITWGPVMKVVGFQVTMCVDFSPDSIVIISCTHTEGWSLTTQDRGFKSCSTVAWKVIGVRRVNCSNIRVFETVVMFVCQSGHFLMSWRDKVRWVDGWTFRGSPGWSISILRVVAEMVKKACEGW